MNIFDFAIKMEIDAATYYRDLAERCGDKGLATILNRLADAELVHERILAEMKEQTPSEAAESNLLSDVKNTFAEMKEESATYDFDLSQIDLYRNAMNNEKKSEEFYREKALEAETEVEKKIFERIADEEKEHYAIIKGLIDFVSRPNTWLEDAEWSHMEVY